MLPAGGARGARRIPWAERPGPSAGPRGGRLPPWPGDTRHRLRPARPATAPARRAPDRRGGRPRANGERPRGGTARTGEWVRRDEPHAPGSRATARWPFLPARLPAGAPGVPVFVLLPCPAPRRVRPSPLRAASCGRRPARVLPLHL
ncbi:hypothetical protein AWN76_003885 [Rhodothermaceae bacterium RA]|nr:hypothetical protein AWN76_003885 [Rhodothermaceae bacterium RA]